MCSIRLNQTAEEQIEGISEPIPTKFRKRLVQFASAANPQNAGPMDSQEGVLRYMPDDLKHVRHYDVGRHRYYITGTHKDCQYDCWLIKAFKKSGVLTEGSAAFNALLKKALQDINLGVMNPDTLLIERE